MRAWVVVCGLVLARAALACDFGGPTDPLTLLETAPIVVVARAESAREFRVTEVLAGEAAGVNAFEGSDCDPRLTKGKPYLLFLTHAGKAWFGAGANDSAVELPDDGLAIRSLVSTLQKWRGAATKAEREKLLPEVEATRVKALVEAAKKRRN